MPARRSSSSLAHRRALLGALLATGLLNACGANQGLPGHVLDEAARAHRTAESFPAADEDYFHDMDGGLPLTREEIQGRNMWLVWTGGNDRFWDGISATSLGTLDFLKTLSSHPTMTYSAATPGGTISGSSTSRASRRPPDRTRTATGCGSTCAIPAARRIRSPTRRSTRASQIGARGKTVPVGSYYGEPSGIVGLRLFPNPEFDEAARKKWDAERYYRDPDYYLSRRPGEAVPRRHVVRFLPRRPESDQAARRSRRTRGGRT